MNALLRKTSGHGLGTAMLVALALGAAPAAVAAPATPTMDEVIARGRSKIGPEDKLAALETLQYVGNIYDDKGQLSGNLVLQFKKPAAQRVELIMPGYTDVSATDGSEGWFLRTPIDGRKTIAIMQPTQLLSFLDTSYENLYFYRGPEHVRKATSTMSGPEDFRGASCWKVTSSYPGNVTYERFFDVASGDLRGTRAEDGKTEMVEAGHLNAGDLEFPAEVQYYGAGKLIRTVKFTKITVNEPVDDKVFAVPSASSLLSLTTGNSGSAPPLATGPAADTKVNVPPAVPQPDEQPAVLYLQPAQP